MYFILFIAIAVASYAVQASLKSKFSTYSKTPLSNGMTGAQVAEKMLRDNGINNVKVTQIEGQLTDHYNPATLTVNLSRNVYYGSSVAAAAVAAHECGHAVQHGLQRQRVTAGQIRQNRLTFVIERRVDERGKRRHGKQSHDGKAHRFSALEIDVIRQRTGQGNCQIDRVHQAHRKEKNERVV